uniref:(northern house mosquito) hypothetical protein n=2 Tax=Culex pipiens TaxID=7175 RepID=A0A8D8DH96_CULPI
MKKQIKQLEQTVEGLLPKFPTAKLSWPVANIKALKELEKGLRSSVAGLEEGLKAKMLKASRNSLLDFVKENLKKLFGQVGRFTWTGSIPKNAKHGEPSYKASGLACIETLIGCSSDAFGEDGEAIEKTIKKGFEQINEARHKLNERRRQEQNLQDHAPVSKPSSSNIVISGPTSGSAAISPTESKPSSMRPPTASKGLTMAVNTASLIKMDRSERNTNSSTPSKNGDIQGSSGEGPKRSIISTSSIKKDRSRPNTTSATPSKIARKKTPSSSTAIDKMCDQFRAVPSHEAHSR